MFGLQGWHLVIIIVLAILLFGAPKLPGMARSMGQSLRIFKSEVKQMKDENGSETDPVEGRVTTHSQSQPYPPQQQHQDPAQPTAGQHLPPFRADDHGDGPGSTNGTPRQSGTSPYNS
jgi:sec-independent protein translocase protein TatA